MVCLSLIAGSSLVRSLLISRTWSCGLLCRKFTGVLVEALTMRNGRRRRPVKSAVIGTLPRQWVRSHGAGLLQPAGCPEPELVKMTENTEQPCYSWSGLIAADRAFVKHRPLRNCQRSRLPGSAE